MALVAVTGGALGAGVARAASPSADDLFRQAFGRDRPATAAADYPLVIDGEQRGAIAVTPGDASTATRVAVDDLAAALSELAEPAFVARLRSRGRNGELSVRALERLGLDAEFDHRELIMRVELPLEYRTQRTLHVQRRYSPHVPSDLEQPAPLSAAVNLRAASAYADGPDRDGEWESSALGIDTAVNVKGAVLEADVRADDDRNGSTWSRDEVRLTVDDPDDAVRYRLGDLRTPAAGRTSGVQLGGFSVAREFRLQPYTDFRPSEARSFELERRSRVEVIVNGVLVRQFSLRPGRYHLDDIPIVAEAVNEIRLRITDDLGNVETLYFSAFNDFRLLEPGVHEFSYGIGYPRERGSREIEYDRESPAFVGSHDYGLTDDLKLGASLQLSDPVRLWGANTVWASPVGSFSLEAAASERDDVGRGDSLGLGYRWQQAPESSPARREVRFTASRESRRFGGLARSEPDQLTRWRYRLRYGQTLPLDVRAQFGVEHREIRTDIDDAWSVSAFASRRFGRASVSIGLEHETGGRNPEDSALISLRLPLGDGSVGARYDSAGDVTELSYTDFGADGVGSTALSGTLTHDRESGEVTGGLTHTGNRFTAAIDQRVTDSFDDDDDALERRTNVRVGTALVYAGGRAAISRPVSDSFVIVGTHPSLGDVDLAADPIRDPLSDEVSYGALSDALGPPVVPDLRSYFHSSIPVAAPEAPTGTSIDNSQISVHPGYRSGYHVELGGSENVALMGMMLAPSGEPVALAAGEVRPGEGDEKPIRFFTNRSGRFYIEGVKAGTDYRIEVTSDSVHGRLDIQVPDDAFGLVRLGEQTLSDFGEEAP